MPEAWEQTSKELWAAAEILKQQHRAVDNSVALKAGDAVPLELMVRPIEMMLRGFALENLMKALWVKQENPIVRQGHYIGVRGAGNHKLAPLANVVGLMVDPKRRDVLERLTLFVTFVGRYPIPTSAAHGFGVGWITPKDDETLNEMVQELQAKLV